MNGLTGHPVACYVQDAARILSRQHILMIYSREMFRQLVEVRFAFSSRSIDYDIIEQKRAHTSTWRLGVEVMCYPTSLLYTMSA